MQNPVPPMDNPELPRLLPRHLDSHKGDFGKLLVVGGSRGMSGAPALAGSAALRAGAGLVTIACPAEIAPIVAGYDPCFMTLPLPGSLQGGLTEASWSELQPQHCDVVALGPGLGRSPQLAAFLRLALGGWQQPVVIDADGLNNLVGNLDLLTARSGATILTPHPGEFARLTGLPPEAIQGDRRNVAETFARTWHVVLVLKGHQTIISDGALTAINETGNPGLATAGTGDVLTGMIGALIGQGLAPFAAAQLGVYLHGLAGDIVAEKLGHVSLTARDLIEALPMAFMQRRRSGSLGFR